MTSATQFTPSQQQAFIKAQRAVAEAREAQRAWAEKSFKERAHYLKTIHYRISERAQTISNAIFNDIQKPVRDAIGGDILPTLDNLKEMLRRGHTVLKPQTPNASLSQFYIGSRSLKIIRQPYGVVGVIGSWNFPIYLNFDPICAALLAGNTVVWKPSEHTPRTNDIIHRMFDTLPKGVFVMLEGGADMGHMLTLTELDRIVFTGSTGTGRKVAAQAGSKLTPVATEMSGKDPFVVLAGADAKLAAQAAAWAICNFAGQNSVKPQRLFVHEKIYTRFAELLVEEINNQTLGLPDNKHTKIGPLVNERAVAVAELLVNEAVEQGAKVLVGGGRAVEMSGHYFQPTILTHVTPHMRVDQMDLWAPVASLRMFTNELEVINAINHHPLGLTASIWHKSPEKAEAFSTRLDVGTVMINTVTLAALDAAAPFCGRRLSGNMERHGVWGIKNMTRPKTITISKGFLPPIYRANYTFSKKWQIVIIALKAGQYSKALKAFFSRRLARED